MRLDTGFFSDELLKLFESYDNIYYVVGVPQHEWLQKKVRHLTYKSYHHSEREYASFAYGEGLGSQFRYYYVERLKKESKGQFDLFGEDEYEYRVIVSNQNCQPHTAFNHYNDRGRDEKHLEELKNQYALGKMVSSDFFVTKALCWVSFLSFTIMGMLRKVAFRLEMSRPIGLRRLRFILFTNMAVFVNHARKKVLKIAMSAIGAWRFKFILQRIWAY